MSQSSNRQAGFGALLLLGVLVLVLGSGIGVYVYMRNTQTEPAAASTSNMPQAPRVPTTKPTPTLVTPTTDGASLVVKEWEVTVPLPDSLKDAYYVPSLGSADPDGSINTIWLGMKSRDTATCAAALGNTGGSTLGAIVRTLPTDTDPVTGKLYSDLYTGTTIGKYFYGFGASVEPDNKCGSIASRADLNTSFGAAVKSSQLSASVQTNTEE